MQINWILKSLHNHAAFWFQEYCFEDVLHEFSPINNQWIPEYEIWLSNLNKEEQVKKERDRMKDRDDWLIDWFTGVSHYISSISAKYFNEQKEKN